MGEMTIFQDIRRGVVCPVYIFFGREALLLDEVLHALVKMHFPEGVDDFNFEIMDGSRVSSLQVLDAARTIPVFAEKRMVIVKDAPWFSGKREGKKEGQEDLEDHNEKELLSYLENPASSTCLVLLAGEKIDARKKLVKAVKKTGQVLEFAPLKGNQLTQWVTGRFKEKGIKADFAAADYLVMEVGDSLAVLDREIEKIVLYLGGKSTAELNDIQPIVSRNFTTNVFDLVDAVAKRDACSAAYQLREIIKMGEVEIKVLVLLARQFRILLQVHSMHKKGFGEKEIADKIGVHPYAVKKSWQQLGNFSFQELIQSLEILRDADFAIKMGKGEPLFLLELAILKMCSREK